MLAAALLALVLIAGQSPLIVFAGENDAAQATGNSRIQAITTLDDDGGGAGNPGNGDDPGTGDPGGGNNDPDPGDPGDGNDPGGTGEPGDPGDGNNDTATEYVTRLMLKYDTADEFGVKHFVGEGSDPAYQTLQILQKGKTVQLNGYYETNKGYGVLFETANSSNNLGEIVLDWTSSDTQIATVSPTGLVTPRGNGSVEITATVRDSGKYQGTAPSKSVSINFDGQEGEYVKDVTIIDIDGNDMGKKSGAVKVFEKENEFFDFFALVSWVNAEGELIRIEDTRTGLNAVSSTVQWSLGGSDLPATINKDTGRLKTTEYSGNGYVICSVTGGVGGKTIDDYAQFQLDTGKYAYNPADSLTIKVVYQEFMDTVVQEHTYTYAELLNRLSSHTYNYTIIGGSRYGTIRAQGFLFKDVVALEGVVLEEVYQFRFGTADGYDNPVSYQQLYGSGARYYFRNWDIGSKAQATPVPPMLAYNSSLVWNKSEVDPSLPLKEDNRFRLAFGPLWECEANSSYQIYYINTLTVVLAGAPPVNPKDETGKTPGGDGTKGLGENGSATGLEGSGAGGDNGGASGQRQRQIGSGGLENAALTLAGAGVTGAIDADDKRGWRVYEMMSKAKSQVAALEFDNPLLPFAAPAAVATVLLGSGFTYGGFKRRLT
jgi:hypothetical protein